MSIFVPLVEWASESPWIGTGSTAAIGLGSLSGTTWSCSCGGSWRRSPWTWFSGAPGCCKAGWMVCPNLQRTHFTPFNHEGNLDLNVIFLLNSIFSPIGPQYRVLTWRRGFFWRAAHFLFSRSTKAISYTFQRLTTFSQRHASAWSLQQMLLENWIEKLWMKQNRTSRVHR